jgi:hypothetical protein
LILAKRLMLVLWWLYFPLSQKWYHLYNGGWLLVLVDPSFVPFVRPPSRMKSMLFHL